MKEKHEKTSVGKKWWLIISTTIFLLFTLVTIGFLMFEIQYYQSQKIALTEKYREQLSEKLSEYESPLTSANIIATLNQNNSYQKDKDGIYQKKFYINDQQFNVQVYGTNRKEIFRTQSWNDGELIGNDSKTQIKKLKNGQTIFQTSMPIISNKSRVLIGYLVITNRLDNLKQLKEELNRLALSILFISAIIAVILGYLLSNQMTKPIKKIQEIISSISEENISTKRIKVSEKNDEFAIVSEHFNELLDKISFYIEQQKHFVEDVSHELRTPVAIVEGHLKLLNRWGKDDPEVLEESLQASLVELQRMKTLVQEMLDLSRAPQVKEHYKDATTNVTEVTKQVVHNFRVLYPEFTFIFDDDLNRDLFIPIYLNHLEQVVIILMDNAVKYSLDRKEIILSLSKGEEHVEIAVQDFGMGMTEEDRKKVFSRFYRVDKARSRERGGNGLGLSIAKELIESYDGEISVTTLLNHGSIFKITLPLTKKDKGMK
ncbi:ATP-binding protein [Granulicatella elegans]|uniref:sensor histidine kinase n=1 Tax=Granulicatella elegans TaxID=137732 RepID=UPI001D153272|nr:ATP-binding protein [Granulicatella elegans]UEA30949.1 HAMP domain-containing histidine kinase [Granulicatella elegans]